jgi:glycosyltransferase involved in cell wall biosynthesis
VSDVAGRVLVFAYFFPPVGGVGVERTLKHVTYLPEFGWSPAVVSVANSGYRLVDPASVSRIPAGVPVLRAPSLEPAHLRRTARWVASTVGWAPQSAAAPPAAPGDRAGTSAAAAAAARPSARSRANAAWARAIPLIFFPDDQLLWGPSAATAGMVAVRRHRPDVLYSSSPPISAHLAAGAVHAMTGIPWVADFRDPWIGNAFARPLPGLHRRLQARIERWIVRSASRVVFATAGLRARYASRYPAEADRFVVIPNGYDRAELRSASARPRTPGPGVFTIVYAGSVYGDRELAIFLDGVERLLEARPELRDRLRVEFFGWLSESNRELAARRLPALDPVVRHLGMLSREDALARVATADAGLLLLAEGPDRDLFVGAKAYEYIGLDRQVLAIAPPGELRERLAELGWGVGADPTPEGVARGIERLLDLPAPAHGADPQGRYERRALARRLAELLDEVSTRPDR